MPYYRVDADEFDEMVEEVGTENLSPEAMGHRPSGDFEYHPPERTTFNPARLGKLAAATLRALAEHGATGFRVRYDGGYDEGFAHPDAILFDEAERSPAAVAKELGTADRVAAIRAAADRPWQAFFHSTDEPKALEGALDELAHELASILLGEGYGTGEYQLYGRFTADLRAGTLSDDPYAEKPRDLDIDLG